MKIEYDLSKHYFKYYNESQGIFLHKKNILKKENKRILGYLENNILNCIISLLIYIFNILFIDSLVIYTIVDFLSFMVFFISLFCIINFFVLYFNAQKVSHKGILEINEFGITDYSEEHVNIGFGWDKIDCVVISKNIITIIQNSNMPIIIFIKNNDEKIIDTIKKYKKDINIIELKK